MGRGGLYDKRPEENGFDFAAGGAVPGAEQTGGGFLAFPFILYPGGFDGAFGISAALPEALRRPGGFLFSKKG